MRGRGLAAAALVAVVALVVPVSLAALAGVGGSGPDERRTTSRPADPPALVPSGDPAAAAELSCDGEVATPDSLPLAGTLQAARLCATTPRYRRWTAPEPLTEDLDVLAEALARLEPAPDDYMCFQSGGSHHYDLRLVVDGEVLSLRTQPSCLEFTVGGVDYLDTNEPFDAFLTAIVAQRSHHDPPPLSPTTALDCNLGTPGQEHALSPLGNPLEMVEAVSCWRPGSKGDVGPWRGAVSVPRARLATLLAEIPARTRRDLGFDSDPCGSKPWFWQDLLGRTRWGDVVVIQGVCETYLLSESDAVAPEDQEFWYPSPRAQRILDGLRR